MPEPTLEPCTEQSLALDLIFALLKGGILQVSDNYCKFQWFGLQTNNHD